ncbi:hypothetical protein CTA2_4862 [Colletotrichum tanaceti]|uniref:Uncharacterized protein n=1 Tax=Colletotrichum tanaceti TaxID=1306861 RepID=A0A4U6XF33_9PEZI|nr:hypothetical protein CTA2_4862 [Colletotrichum tanaceti]TKW54325.1 hypothetical protein CTA1_327 [Colletotrichum tanaceti]
MHSTHNRNLQTLPPPLGSYTGTKSHSTSQISHPSRESGSRECTDLSAPKTLTAPLLHKLYTTDAIRPRKLLFTRHFANQAAWQPLECHRLAQLDIRTCPTAISRKPLTDANAALDPRIGYRASPTLGFDEADRFSKTLQTHIHERTHQDNPSRKDDALYEVP